MSGGLGLAGTTCRGWSYAEPCLPQEPRSDDEKGGRSGGARGISPAVVRQLISWAEVVDQVAASAPKVGSQ